MDDNSSGAMQSNAVGHLDMLLTQSIICRLLDNAATSEIKLNNLTRKKNKK